MVILDDFEIEDTVSGLKIKVIPGKSMCRLHIEHISKPVCNNRDFWFSNDGSFDGTGSSLCEQKTGETES